VIRLKTEKQIAGIRESGKLLVEVLKSLIPEVGPGVSTQFLDTMARKQIERGGGRPSFLGYHGFPAALCTSVDSAVIHGIPDDKSLSEGQIVGIDCGIDLNGFYSDAAVSVAVGSISPKVEKLLRVTKESLYRGVAAARVGNRVNDISRAIEQHVSEEGFGIVRPYCGHGVGLAIHEDPQVPNYVGPGPNPRLKPGMVLAIEPMVNLGDDDVDVLDDDWTVVTVDGSVSAHYEFTVVVLSDGPEILTPWDG
jgi:methionyl aminopeptidase